MSELGILVEMVTITHHSGMAQRWAGVRMLREPTGVTLILDAQRYVHVPTAAMACLEWTLPEAALTDPGPERGAIRPTEPSAPLERQRQDDPDENDHDQQH